MTPEQIEMLRTFYFGLYAQALTDQFGEEYLLNFPGTETFFNSIFATLVPEIEKMNGAVISITKAMVDAGQEPTPETVMAQMFAQMGQ